MSWRLSIFFLSLLVGFSACKKDENNDGDASKKYMLVIDNGPQTVAPDESPSFRAVLIDEQGQRSTPSNVSWTSSQTGVATISASGQVSIAQAGITIVRASVEIEGTTLTAEAPLNVRIPGLFVVAPSAILVDTEFPNIQLEPVYLGTQTTSYSYSSSNDAVASVSSTGDVDFRGAGSCEITVTANDLDGSPSVVVPVLVIAVPQVELPVVRIELSPSSHTILRNETASFTARAFNSSGTEVTNASFTWSVEDPSIASIDANGTVSPLAVGETMVRVEASGLVATAELTVVPDEVLLLDPYFVSLGSNQSRQFTATLHPVTRVNGELALGAGSTPSNLQWEIPTYGFPIFDIATVNSSGLVTMRDNITPGVSTIVLASIPGNPDVEPGAAMILAAVSGPCDCGTQNANATQLVLTSPSTITVGFGQQVQIQAEVRDASGAVISSAPITYCSNDLMAVDVDFDGNVTATGFGGSTTVRVCHGNLSQTVTVNY